MLSEKYNIPKDDMMITQKDMAQLLNVAPRTLIRWDKSGDFTARRKPNGQPYYLIRDYHDFHDRSKKRGAM